MFFFDFKPGSVFGEYTALGLLGGRLFHTQCRTMVEMCTLTADDIEEVFGCVPHAMTNIVKRAKTVLNMTIKKFKLEKRANMLKQLTRKKRYQHQEEEISMSDRSMGDGSWGDSESMSVGKEEAYNKSEEKVVETEDDDVDEDEELMPTIETKLSKEKEEKGGESKGDMLSALRGIIQSEIRPLRNEIKRLKHMIQDESHDEDENSAYNDIREYSKHAGHGLHQRARRNSLIE